MALTSGSCQVPGAEQGQSHTPHPPTTIHCPLDPPAQVSSHGPPAVTLIRVHHPIPTPLPPPVTPQSLQLVTLLPLLPHLGHFHTAASLIF